MNNKNRRFTFATSIIAAMALFGVAACGDNGDQNDTGAEGTNGSEAGNGAETVNGDSDELIELNVRTDVYFMGAVLPLVAGVQSGIFEDHGLDVDLKEGDGSATTIQTVNNGSDDIGYADAGTLVQSVAQGIDVKMVSGMVQASPLALYTFEDSGINSPADLEGKTAGYTAGSAAEQLFPAYAKAADIDEDAITFQNVDIPTRTQIFMSGDTDFTFGLLNVSGPNIADKCDCEPVAFPYKDVGVQTLSSGIIVGADFMEEHPDAVTKFLEALDEAVNYSNENIDEALEAFYAYASESELNETLLANQWETSMELAFTENTEGQSFGCMASEDWESTISLMEQYAEVEEDKVMPADIATNRFNPGTCKDDLGE